jgi:hypothetical protein
MHPVIVAVSALAPVPVPVPVLCPVAAPETQAVDAAIKAAAKRPRVRIPGPQRRSLRIPCVQLTHTAIPEKLQRKRGRQKNESIYIEIRSSKGILINKIKYF